MQRVLRPDLGAYLHVVISTVHIVNIYTFSMENIARIKDCITVVKFFMVK